MVVWEWWFGNGGSGMMVREKVVRATWCVSLAVRDEAPRLGDARPGGAAHVARDACAPARQVADCRADRDLVRAGAIAGTAGVPPLVQTALLRRRRREPRGAVRDGRRRALRHAVEVVARRHAPQPADAAALLHALPRAPPHVGQAARGRARALARVPHLVRLPVAGVGRRLGGAGNPPDSRTENPAWCGDGSGRSGKSPPPLCNMLLPKLHPLCGRVPDARGGVLPQIPEPQRKKRPRTRPARSGFSFGWYWGGG
eukprot:gene6282-biopygen20850